MESTNTDSVKETIPVSKGDLLMMLRQRILPARNHYEKGRLTEYEKTVTEMRQIVAQL